MLTAIALAAVAATATGGATMDSSWTFRAGGTARVVAIRGGRLATSSFRAGRSAATEAAGPEFRICIGESARVLSSDEFASESLKSGTIRCRGPQGAPDVTVVFAPDARLGVVRKTLKVTNTTGAPLLLRWAEVESVKPGEPVTYAAPANFPLLRDWGQPVFTKHLFFGIEFPAARSTALPDGSLQMREYPGRILQPAESWTSHAAVTGASASGDVAQTFLDYIAALSPHAGKAGRAAAPAVPRPFIYWNGFRVIMPPDRTDQGLRMVERARELKRLTGFTFDSWTYDAGFDMYRPDGLFVPYEPEIWKRTRAALEDVGTPLGFWTSFSCIFDTFTQEWGAKQGYGLQHEHAYCLAEPTYFHAIEERLSQIVRENGMRSINFDGMYWGQGYGCNKPGHGHLVGEGDEAGVYGTYAVVEKEMEIFTRLRRERPDICMDLFVCHEWASPWWLMEIDGVHTVAGDTVAAGIPSPWLRDELITVRDMQVWELHRHLGRQFPLWAEDLYGNQVRADHLIDGIEVRGESMGARWEDEFVMAVAARGAIQNHIVCCDLHVLAQTASGLRFLGEVGNWIRANAQVYRHFALLGGEPAKQETFGYAHGDGHGRAIVGLRNPSIRTQTFPLTIGPDFHIGEAGPYQVTMVYPYRYTWPMVRAGETLPIPLADFEVAILEVRARSRRFAGLPEGRWDVKEGQIVSAGAEADLPAPGVNLAVQQAGPPCIAGRVALAAGISGQLQVRVDPPNGTKDVGATATIDGKEVPAQVHFRDRGGSQDAWILVDISPGEHEIGVRLACPGPMRLEAWLQYRAQHAFKPTAQAAPAGLLPALEPAEQRATCLAIPETKVGSQP
jgi:hypothetical protein